MALLLKMFGSLLASGAARGRPAPLSHRAGRFSAGAGKIRHRHRLHRTNGAHRCSDVTRSIACPRRKRRFLSRDSAALLNS